MLPVTRRQKVFANGTLVIQQARQSEDQGTYTCQAVNRQKHTARRDVEVSVQSEYSVPAVEPGPATQRPVSNTHCSMPQSRPASCPSCR